MKRGDKLMKIKGLVIPMDWDEKGKVVAVAVSTYNEDEYHIDKNYKGEELLDLLQEEVEVSGVVREKEDKKKMTVKEYSLRKDARSRENSLNQNKWY